MTTRVLRIDAWQAVQNDRPRLDDLPFMLSLDDADATHTHDDVGHAFPATREQLEALRRQIDEALR